MIEREHQLSFCDARNILFLERKVNYMFCNQSLSSTFIFRSLYYILSIIILKNKNTSYRGRVSQSLILNNL